VTGSRPRLLLAQALLALASGRVEAVDAPLNAAEHAFGEAADEPFESTAGMGSWLLNVPATVTTQRAYLAALRGDAEEAATFASRALAEIGEDEWMLESIARWNLALADWLRGRLAEAECGLLSTISRWPAVGERGLGAVMLDHLGQVQLAQGA
jgi:ATP/maltotriose-dependent transcriptional regulator MalT